MLQPYKAAYIAIEGLNHPLPITAYMNTINDNPILGSPPHIKYKPNNHGKVTIEGSCDGLDPVLYILKERPRPLSVVAMNEDSTFSSVYTVGAITNYEVEHNGYNLLLHLTTEITQQSFQRFEISLSNFMGIRTCYTSFLIKDFPKEYEDDICGFFERYLPDLRVTTTLGVIEAYGHLDLNETLALDPTLSKFPYMSGGESSILLEVTPLDGGGTRTFYHKASKEPARISESYEDLISYSERKAQSLLYSFLKDKHGVSNEYCLPQAPQGIYIATVL